LSRRKFLFIDPWSAGPRLALIPPSKANPELRAAYERLRESMDVRGGMPLAPRIMQCLSRRPNLTHAAADGYRFAGWGGRLQRALVALAVVGMLGAFHFVNRVADILGIEREIPIVQRR